MNPTGTLFAGLGVTQIADIITWLSTWPVTAPPQNVSMAVAALIFAGAHMAVSVFNDRKAPVVAAPVVVAQPVASIPSQPSSVTGIAQLAEAQMQVAIKNSTPAP